VSKQSPEQKRRLPPIAIVGIILAVICGISLYIRIYLPYNQIFVNGWVWFRGIDDYWYMRNIENLVHHFPHFNSFDPYVFYPFGGVGLARPFFAWLISAIILLISRGVPTLHTMEAITAYVPPILGTLTLIPVYFIGKALFNRWVGVISAALVAILPGEFMHRSLLGYIDHHVAEALFSTVCILFLIMAIKRAREREISFDHILNRDWSTITKPLVYTLLAGIFLGTYLLTWQGGLLFVFIIFAYLVIQFVVDHLGHKSSDYLCIIGTPVFLIGFLMLLPILGKGGLDTISLVSLPIAIVVPIVLSIISRLMADRALKPVYYPLTLLGLVGIGLAALYGINSSLFQSMLNSFSIFSPGGAMLTVGEAHPPTAGIIWSSFTTSFFISFISFAMIIYIAVKEQSADKTLFLVWSVIMLIAVLGQRRFGYYYAINAALLTGYFSWKMLDIAGLSRLLARSKEVVEAVKAKEFKRKKKKTREKMKPRTFMEPRGAWIRVIVVGIVIFFVVFFPNISGTKEALATSQTKMDEGWYTSLLWLKDNSPEPFGDPDFYYELYETPFHYPESAYGVMSWWDYGYYIMQIAHRMPNANPSQAGAVAAGLFFTAQNESSASGVRLMFGTKYVVIDSLMPTAKFYAMVDWAGRNESEFFETYYVPAAQTGGQGQWATLLYPAYYQSMVVRLYNFDGKAVTPTQSIVISYDEKVASGGGVYKEVTSAQSFATYKEAEAYISNQASGNYRIVGTSRFSSPVPLKALNSYKLVHQSEATTTVEGQRMPSVKIFEYIGSGES
jgi:oligosaccharyl transferase (archaeosortase A-associated)